MIARVSISLIIFGFLAFPLWMEQSANPDFELLGKVVKLSGDVEGLGIVKAYEKGVSISIVSINGEEERQIRLVGRYKIAVLASNKNEYAELIARNAIVEKIIEEKIIVEGLRSTYAFITYDECISMLKKYNFYGSDNKIGNYRHNYELKIISGDKVIIDHITSLVWHQSVSKNMEFRKVDKWIDELNHRTYAGYSDWRLPTLEEAASLVENKKNKDGYYIDPIFFGGLGCWTGDWMPRHNQFGQVSNSMWIVYFANYRFRGIGPEYSDPFDFAGVLPVRSLK